LKTEPASFISDSACPIAINGSFSIVASPLGLKSILPSLRRMLTITMSTQSECSFLCSAHKTDEGSTSKLFKCQLQLIAIDRPGIVLLAVRAIAMR
jgi:uncharacterized membrane protein YraQ (UPF0718 family)